MYNLILKGSCVDFLINNHPQDQYDNADGRVINAVSLNSFSRSKAIFKSMILDFYQSVLAQEGYSTDAAKVFADAVNALPDRIRKY